ncbi:MAG: prolipoprotein diacylglyceryl transferase, partial [Kiritimatiellae bacterium]|nr:prolipoprotein diacylglyceryl transferase [Kiritimatiellia bacterium]
MFRLGQFQLHSYGLCMAVGILSAYAALGSLARGRGWNSDRLSNLVALLVFGGLAGARAFFVAEHWSWYAGDPLAVLRIWEGGLMYYGSIVAGAAILAAWCVATKTPPLPLFDLFAAVVPLGQAFGRVGCFMNGCCHGRVADSFVSVAFPAGSPPWMDQVRAGLIPQSAARSLPVLPVQLFEAAGCFLLFLALRRLFRTKRAENAPGLVLAAYLAGYGALRFATELLRADERARPFGGPLSISQCISLAALAL